MSAIASSVQSVPVDAAPRRAVTRADLPLSCPMPGTALWNMHPRVFLPVESQGRVECPYCGTTYTFDEA